LHCTFCGAGRTFVVAKPFVAESKAELGRLPLSFAKASVIQLFENVTRFTGATEHPQATRMFISQYVQLPLEAPEFLDSRDHVVRQRGCAPEMIALDQALNK